MLTPWTTATAPPWPPCSDQGRRCKRNLGKPWRQPSAKSILRNQLFGHLAIKTPPTTQQAFIPSSTMHLPNTALASISWPATSPQVIQATTRPTWAPQATWPGRGSTQIFFHPSPPLRPAHLQLANILQSFQNRCSFPQKPFHLAPTSTLSPATGGSASQHRFTWRTPGTTWSHLKDS